MKLNYCILLIFFCATAVLAEAQKKQRADRPPSHYLQVSLQDSIDVINDLADTLCMQYDEKGLRLATTALHLSKQINYHIGIGDASHSLGLTKFRRNNDSAILYFKQARSEYSKQFPGFEKMAFTLNNLSRTYYELLQFDSSLHYAQMALAFVQNNYAAPDIRSKWTMYTYGAIANTFGGQSRYDSCNYYYLKAITLAEKAGNHTMLNVYFKGLSAIQSRWGYIEKAAFYAKKAISYIKADCGALSIALTNLGSIYGQLKDFANADKMADSSIKVGKACNVWNTVGRNYSILGNSQMEQKNYAAALRYFNTGMQQALQHHNSKTSIGILHRKLGDAYEALDSIPEATQSYLNALKIVEGDHEMTNAVYLSLSHLSYRAGDVNNAYKYIKRYNAFKDSAYSTEKIKIISELNARYETEKKDQQLLLLTKEKELQQALVNKQLQQIAKNKAEKREKELEIINYQLEADKQQQILQIQQLDIENSMAKQRQQQMQLLNTGNKLEIERKEKKLSLAVVKNQRNWFMFLLLAILITGIALYLLFNRYKLVKKIQTLNKLHQQRELISRELHDELGATLSGIAMYSHLAKEQAKDLQNCKFDNSLNIIQSNAAEMVNKLNDIVWLINPGHDSLQKLVQRLEEYAGEMAAIKNMQLKINVPGQLSAQNLPVESRRNIYLFCKEAINNAVKYSGGNMLELTVKESNQILEISISDNGKGFDAENVKRGNGLNNMQKRAGELGGEFDIQSKPGEGCSILLKLKITQ